MGNTLDGPKFAFGIDYLHDELEREVDYSGSSYGNALADKDVDGSSNGFRLHFDFGNLRTARVQFLYARTETDFDAPVSFADVKEETTNAFEAAYLGKFLASEYIIPRFKLGLGFGWSDFGADNAYYTDQDNIFFVSLGVGIGATIALNERVGFDLLLELGARAWQDIEYTWIGSRYNLTQETADGYGRLSLGITAAF